MKTSTDYSLNYLSLVAALQLTFGGFPLTEQAKLDGIDRNVYLDSCNY